MAFDNASTAEDGLAAAQSRVHPPSRRGVVSCALPVLAPVLSGCADIVRRKLVESVSGTAARRVVTPRGRRSPA